MSYWRMPRFTVSISLTEEAADGTREDSAAWKKERAYHRSDRRVRNSIELVEVKLVVGANVDVSTLVLRHVAVLGRRED